jgi:hypothetical protein
MRSRLGAPVADDVLAGLEIGESPHMHAGYKRPIRHGIEIVSQEFDLILLLPHLRRNTVRFVKLKALQRQGRGTDLG